MHSQMPGVCPGGGMSKFQFDGYITSAGKQTPSSTLPQQPNPCYCDFPLTGSPPSVSQSGLQAKLLHDLIVSLSTGLVLLEQLLLCTYWFAVIFMRHITSRVCWPLPHDLEQSVHSVCHLYSESKLGSEVMDMHIAIHTNSVFASLKRVNRELGSFA